MFGPDVAGVSPNRRCYEYARRGDCPLLPGRDLQPPLLGLAHIPVAEDSVAHGGWERLEGAAARGPHCCWGEALGLPSPTRVRNSKEARRRLCLRRLLVELVNEIL